MNQETSILELINTDPGSSFRMLELDVHNSCQFNYFHEHPEYEITYVSSGNGTKRIGSHFSRFTEGELVMMSSHLPHSNIHVESPDEYTELVLQIPPDLLDSTLQFIPEFTKLRQLLELSQCGLCFYGETKSRIGDLMFKAKSGSGVDRFATVLMILDLLSKSSEYTVLNPHYSRSYNNNIDNARLCKINDYIAEHFAEDISMENIAQEVSVSYSYLCRLLKRHTQKTLTELINEFRIAKACDLLIKNELLIYQIAFEVGFKNISYFNRQFKKFTSLSPIEFQSKF